MKSGCHSSVAAGLEERLRAVARRGRHCGCTTVGWSRSRAAVRPARSSGPRVRSVAVRRPAHPTRTAVRRSPGGPPWWSCRRAAPHARTPASVVSHSGTSSWSRPSRWTTDRAGRSSSRHQTTSVLSPKVQIIATPVPFSGSASGWATTGTGTPKSGVDDLRYRRARASGRRRDGRRRRRTPRGVRVGWCRSRCQPRPRRWKSEPVVGGRGRSVLDLGLCDGSLHVDVPHRRGFAQVGLARERGCAGTPVGRRAWTGR